MFLNSIRWRLQLWHGLLLVLVLAGFGLTAYQLQRANQLERIDQDLQLRVAILGGVMRRAEGPHMLPGHPPNGPEPEPRPGFAEPPGELPGPPPEQRDPKGFRPMPPPPALRLSARDLSLFDGATSNSFYYVMWARDGRRLGSSESAPSNVPPPGDRSSLSQSLPDRPTLAPGRGPGTARMRGTLRELIHFMPPGECILVGRDIRSELGDLRRFAALLLGAGGAVLCLGLAGGWWLSTRAIRPIRDISATAAKISTGDLSQRIPAADTDNELGQLASVLNSTFARLEAAFSQQARFTSDAAHELRTPVSVMLTQTQSALAREREATEYRQTLEACQRAAQRMRRLIESLLELARLDAGQEPIKQAPVDFSQLATDCIELVRPLAAERGIAIHPQLSRAECIGDADRLALVITNLLTNAVHYNKDGGEIRVVVQPDAPTPGARLTVTDNGVGISAEDVPRIFERFWRADKSRSHAQGRTGLGLSIAKHIVDAHGGSIEIQTAPGQGSTFTVHLPRAVAFTPQHRGNVPAV